MTVHDRDAHDVDCERGERRRWPWRTSVVGGIIAAVIVALFLWKPWNKTPMEELLSHMRPASADELKMLNKVGVLPPWADEVVFFAEEDFVLPENATHLTIVVPEGVRWKGGNLDLVSLIRFQKWEEDPTQFVRIYDRLCELERLIANQSNARSDGSCRSVLRNNDANLPSPDDTAKWHDASIEEMQALLPNYDPKTDQRGLVFEGKGAIPQELVAYGENEPRREDWRTIVIRWDASLTQLGGPLDRIRLEDTPHAVVDQLCWGVARPPFVNAHPGTFAPDDSARDTNCRLN